MGYRCGGGEPGSVAQMVLTPKELTCEEFLRGNILDVGCGSGRFAVALLKQGYATAVTAIDVSDICVALTKKHFEIAGVAGNLLRLDVEEYHTDDDFDTIACWEVLEHLVHPYITIQKLSRFLTPTGVLIGSVPEGRANDNVLHLHHFNPMTLMEMLMECFLQVRIRRYYIDGADVTHLVFVAGLVK